MTHNPARAVRAIAVAATLLFAGLPSLAADPPDVAVLAKAMLEAPAALERGLEASRSEGTPISARYEIEDGVLQLTVYTMSLDQFTKVIFDLRSGAIKESHAITAGRDLKVAGAQGAAMSWARMSLEDVIGNALRAIPGYRAVAVEPTLESGHPIATTTLVKGQSVRQVIETLE